MNTKILYFVLFLIMVNYFTSIEGLDIDAMMENKMNKIKDKVGNNKTNTIDDKDSSANPALQDNYGSNIDGMVAGKLQNALGKDNNVNISSEEGEFENQIIENPPKIDSNNEKAGGMNNVIIIIAFIIVVLTLMKN